MFQASPLSGPSLLHIPFTPGYDSANSRPSRSNMPCPQRHRMCRSRCVRMKRIGMFFTCVDTSRTPNRQCWKSCLSSITEKAYLHFGDGGSDAARSLSLHLSLSPPVSLSYGRHAFVRIIVVPRPSFDVSYLPTMRRTSSRHKSTIVFTFFPLKSKPALGSCRWARAMKLRSLVTQNGSSPEVLHTVMAYTRFSAIHPKCERPSVRKALYF